ncbi:MAG TPA: helix-hairpin-helix domain-containing protein [Planctomycetota bacterium]|nr:helix-hairpin-helix domain-containing protein [Planctomycetota bacterium]
MPLPTPEIAALLIEIGQRLELGGESPFKARAYYTAAENLLSLTEPLPDLIARGKLRTIPGVGEAIAEKILKLYNTGTHPTLDRLRDELPAGVLALLRIPGLGPKKVAQLYNDLKISSIEELEAACRDGRIRDCKGMSQRTETKILQQLELMRRNAGSCHLHTAEERTAGALERLPQLHPEWTRIEAAGDFRRRCEVVNDITFAAVSKEGVNGDVMAEGMPVRVSSAENFGAAWIAATGSDEHLEKLAKYAESKGLKWSEAGLSKGAKPVPCAKEEDVYATLGLPFIPPELREGQDEIELAAAGKLPVLVTDADIRGVVHSHTDFSDGAQTLQEMADAVRGRGYEYYGVSDHSQSAGYAGGLKEAKITAQHKLADELNAKYPAGKFRIFKGIESDIKEDGSLDYPDKILAQFDFIVASLHSRLTLPKEEQTRRVLKAVSNKYTTILGHMTGRLLLRRDPAELDVEEVLKACARHGVVVEVNANPHRLDVDWRYHRKGLELGCMFAINPDAHAIDELDLTHYGVMVARKGGLTKDRVLNCMNLAEFSAFLERKRG